MLTSAMDASPLADQRSATLAHRCRRRGVHPIGSGMGPRIGMEKLEVVEYLLGSCPLRLGGEEPESLMSKDQHVTPNPKGGWSVRASGATNASKIFERQAEAVAHARDVARREKSELFVHGRDGSIRERNSYGRDPMPPRDKR